MEYLRRRIFAEEETLLSDFDRDWLAHPISSSRAYKIMLSSLLCSFLESYIN